MKMRLGKPGFTLVEVVVATTISGFIALVAIGALRAVTAGAQLVELNINGAAEVRFASKMLRRDLGNMYRPKNKRDTKFVAIADDSGPVPSSYMVFYAINRTKARILEPEGDIYEVEYYIMADEEKSVLMRRLWPNPHEDFEPGGILTTVADDIEVFQVRYFDGEEWTYDWPEEMQSLPVLIEITLVGRQIGPGQPAMETIYINLVRSTGTLLNDDESASDE